MSDSFLHLLLVLLLHDDLINHFQIVYSFISFRHDSYKANDSVNLEWFAFFCLALELGHVQVVKHAVWPFQSLFNNHHKRYHVICIRAPWLSVWYWLLTRFCRSRKRTTAISQTIANNIIGRMIDDLAISDKVSKVDLTMVLLSCKFIICHHCTIVWNAYELTTTEVKTMCIKGIMCKVLHKIYNHTSISSKFLIIL